MATSIRRAMTGLLRDRSIAGSGLRHRIGGSGVIDHKGGNGPFTRHLIWREVPIGRLVQKTTGIPTHMTMMQRSRDRRKALRKSQEQSISTFNLMKKHWLALLNGKLYRGYNGERVRSTYHARSCWPSLPLWKERLPGHFAGGTAFRR